MSQMDYFYSSFVAFYLFIFVFFGASHGWSKLAVNVWNCIQHRGLGKTCGGVNNDNCNVLMLIKKVLMILVILFKKYY